MSRTFYNRLALALLFVGAGILHFVRPATYLAIVPPWLPSPSDVVAVSGMAEIVLGLLILPLPTRRLGGWGLLLLLVAVFPANLYMAEIHEQLHIPAWVAWGRLPLQLLLLWWVWRSTIYQRRSRRHHLGRAQDVLLG
jgi:uncharacterized membrane protein